MSGLVRFTKGGKDKFLTAEGVTAVTEWEVEDDGKACTRIWYGPDHGHLVDGSPREVYAALFPPMAAYDASQKQERLREALRFQAQGGWIPPLCIHTPGAITQEQAVSVLEQGASNDGLSVGTWRRIEDLVRPRIIVGSDPEIYVPIPDVAEALNPVTYEAEWGPYTPEQVRCMRHALALVRARLGVGL